MRDFIAERFTPEQLAEGQKLGREWFEAHPPESPRQGAVFTAFGDRFLLLISLFELGTVGG